jgi:catechol 2,3-dioxygenase-like lactoylglutathione lyase family enzyme
MKAVNRALRALVCCALICLSLGVHAETVDLTRYLLRVDTDLSGERQDAFKAVPGTAVLAIEGTADALTVTLNGQAVQPGEVTLRADNVIELHGDAAAPLRVRITQGAEAALDVLSRIHFNTNVSDFEAARAFYGMLGFETLSDFPDANTVAMAQAIGIAEPTSYDGSRGGEPGGYLLHGELIGLGFNRGVIDLIEFTIPRNDEAPYPALNRLGMARAVFETADIDADYATLTAKGVRFLSAPVQRADGTRFAILTDLDGTFYELRQVDGDVDEDAPTQLHRVGAVVINVSDLRRSLEWYRMLGFEPTGDLTATETLAVAQAMGFDAPVEIRGTLLTHRADGSQIELVEWLEPFDPTPPYPIPINHLGIHRMAFTSGDIEGDVAQLVAQGVEMISPITPCCSGPDAWGSIVAFYDPDGTILELAEMPVMTWLQRFMNLFN